MARGASRSDPGFRVIAQLTDRFTKPIQGINQKIAQSTSKFRAMAAVPGAIARSAGLDKIGGAFANIGTQVGKLRSSVTGLLGPFARIGAIVGGISLGTFVADMVKSGSELVKLNQSTGIAIETLQQFQYAAKQSGVPVESMNDSLSKLNRSIASARKDTKGTSEQFKALTKGVGLTRQELNTLSAQQIFERTASAIANIEDPIKRVALAQAVFGKSGADLIPVLQEGAWGLRALADEADELGIVMSTDMAKATKEFDDTMTRLGGHIKGVALAAFKELLPSMQGGAKSMDEWVKANRDWIKTEIVEVVRDFVSMAKAAYTIINESVVPAIKSLQPYWQAFEDIVGKGNARLLLFTSVVAPGIIGAILGIAKAVVGLGVALVANPVGAIILAIVAAIAGAAYLIWKHWDSIVSAFAWAWDEIGNAVQTGIDFVVGLWDVLPANIRNALIAAAEAAAAVAGQIADAIVLVFNAPMETVDALWNALPAGVRGYLVQIADAISGMAGQLRDAIVSALTGPIDYVKQKWNELVGWFTGIFSTITEKFGALGRLVGIGGGGGGGGGAGAEGGDPVAAAAAATPADARNWWQRNAPGMLGGQTAAGPQALATAAQAQKSETKVAIDIKGLPPGSTVDQRSTGDADVRLNAAYSGQHAMAGAY